MPSSGPGLDSSARPLSCWTAPRPLPGTRTPAGPAALQPPRPDPRLTFSAGSTPPRARSFRAASETLSSRSRCSSQAPLSPSKTPTGLPTAGAPLSSLGDPPAVSRPRCAPRFLARRRGERTPVPRPHRGARTTQTRRGRGSPRGLGPYHSPPGGRGCSQPAEPGYART